VLRHLLNSVADGYTAVLGEHCDPMTGRAWLATVLGVRRWPTHLTVTLPPLVLAAIGLTHPMELAAETAGWWTTMHILLLPLLPLLGVALWGLVRDVSAEPARATSDPGRPHPDHQQTVA